MVSRSIHDFTIIAMPSEFMGGAGIRSLNVLPYIKSLLEDLNVQYHLYVPCFSSSLLGLNIYAIKGDLDPEEVLKHIESNLKLIAMSDAVPSDLLNTIYDTVKKYTLKHAMQLYSSKWNKYLHRLFFLIKRDHIARYMENECLKVFMKVLSTSGVRHAIYSMHEWYDTVYASKEMSEKSNSYSIVLLQAEPFTKLNNLIMYARVTGLSRTIRNVLLGRGLRKLYIEFMRSGKLRKILSVSAAPIVASGILELANQYNVAVDTLRPGNAVDPKAFEYRRFDKDLLAVFCARLCREKGLFDLLRIWAYVSAEIPDAKLVVIGKFEDDKTKRLFLRDINKLKLRNLIYLGHIRDRDLLYRIVSQAKLLIYPSYLDAFPLAVLEALALGTSVVAYDIPAIVSVYKGLPAVKIVKYGDVRAAAQQSIEMLRLDYNDYVKMHENEFMKKFLEMHSSWYRVAETELRCILSSLN